MTAEDRLKDWYEECAPLPNTVDRNGNVTGHVNPIAGIYLAPEHIDLIADLVVERLKEEK